MSKLFNLNPRKPNTVNEEAARRLEEAIAAKGEGVAGQAAVAVAVAPVVAPVPAPVATPVVVLQSHELTSSSEAPEQAEAAPTVVAAGAVAPEPEPEVTAVVELPAQVRSSVSSRARSATKSRARELPTTGVGTLHNPRVRKTDGVKTRSTTVHLPVELAKKLAVHCAMSGRKQSEVIAEAVESLLG